MRKILRYIPFSIILGLLILIIMSIFMAIGTARLCTAYEKRAVEQRVAFVEDKCSILANQILNNGITSYSMLSDADTSDLKVDELEQFAVELEGRVMIIDRNFHILADTYKWYSGRFFMSNEMIRAINGEEIESKHIGDSYIQVMTGVHEPGSKKITAIIIATASIRDSMRMGDYLRSQRATLY